MYMFKLIASTSEYDSIRNIVFKEVIKLILGHGGGP